MVRLNWLIRIVLFISVALGALGGILDLYNLLFISVAIIIIALSIEKSIQHYRMVFLFPLIFLSCLPINIRLALAISSIEYSWTLYSLVFLLLILLSLISVEELIICVIGLILWGDQEIIRYKEPFQMIRSDYRQTFYIRGYFPIKKRENEMPTHYLHKI